MKLNCEPSFEEKLSPKQFNGSIFLVGENHGVEKILMKELELWRKYYQEESMRHLFVELPYYSAELLNLWMLSDNNDILDELYKDWEGTLSHNPFIEKFYLSIKNECPETIFHGTDVGHQYKSSGQRYLDFLEANNLGYSEKFKATQKSIEQGKYYYENSDHVFRENALVENFIYEYDKLQNESIMGIYGAAHTEFDAMDYMTGSVACMAGQLKEKYGEAVHSENLILLVKNVEPLRTDKIVINQTEYTASYFGSERLFGRNDYSSIEFWRLENAYATFKDSKKAGTVLPYVNYPMVIETGQVFVIDYTKTDGSVRRMYYRSDGNQWKGLLTTVEISIK